MGLYALISFDGAPRSERFVDFWKNCAFLQFRTFQNLYVNVAINVYGYANTFFDSYGFNNGFQFNGTDLIQTTFLKVFEFFQPHVTDVSVVSLAYIIILYSTFCFVYSCMFTNMMCRVSIQFGYPKVYYSTPLNKTISP